MKAAGTEQADHAFLALARHDAEFDVALLDVVDRIAFGALPEDVALGRVGRDRPAGADRGQERFGVEGFRGPGAGLPVATRPAGPCTVPWLCFSARWHLLISKQDCDGTVHYWTLA